MQAKNSYNKNKDTKKLYNQDKFITKYEIIQYLWGSIKRSTQ